MGTVTDSGGAISMPGGIEMVNYFEHTINNHIVSCYRYREVME